MNGSNQNSTTSTDKPVNKERGWGKRGDIMPELELEFLVLFIIVHSMDDLCHFKESFLGKNRTSVMDTNTTDSNAYDKLPRQTIPPASASPTLSWQPSWPFRWL